MSIHAEQHVTDTDQASGDSYSNLEILNNTQRETVDSNVGCSGDTNRENVKDDGIDIPPSYASSQNLNVFPSISYLKRLKHATNTESCSSFYKLLLFLICMLSLFFPIMSLLIILLPVCYVVKSIYSVCIQLWGRQSPGCGAIETLSHQEKMWLIDEAKVHVTQTLLFIETGLDFYQIRNLIASRVIYAECSNGERLYPRFCRKVVKLPVGFGWMDDESFTLERHIVPMSASVTCLESLRVHVNEMAQRPIHFDQPLWQIQVLSNFGASKETVILFRMHPCFANGISLTRLLMESFADDKSKTLLCLFYSPYIYAINCFRAFFLIPIVFLEKWIFTSRDYNFIHNTSLISTKSLNRYQELTLAWSDEFSLESANRIKNVARSSLNDILLSISSSVLRKYLQYNGTSNPKDCQILLPVDMNSHDVDIRLQLRCNYVNFTLPTSIEGNIPRLWETKNRVNSFKNSADAVVLRAICWISNNILPFFLWRKLHSLFLNKFSAVISNLPGPEKELRICSKAIKQIVCWSPPVPNVSISLSFFTYNGKLNMSVVGEKSILPDPHRLTEDFMTEVEDRLCEVQKEILEIRQSLQMAQSDSEDEITAYNTIETLKCEFRQLLAELRKILFSKNTVFPSDEEEVEEICSQDARRRSTRLSIASLHSSSSASRSIELEEHDRAPRSSICAGHDFNLLPMDTWQRESIIGVAEVHTQPSPTLHESSL